MERKPALSPNVAYSAAARCVKIVLWSFLDMFTKKCLIATSKRVGRSIFSIPQPYVEIAETADKLRAAGIKVRSDSLHHIPDSSQPIKFRRVPQQNREELGDIYRGIVESSFTQFPEELDPSKFDFQTWLVELDTHDTEQGASPPLDLSNFDLDKDQIKELIVGLFRATVLVLQSILHNEHELRTITLIPDVEQNQIQLVDTNFPKYKHNIVIAAHLRRV